MEIIIILTVTLFLVLVASITYEHEKNRLEARRAEVERLQRNRPVNMRAELVALGLEHSAIAEQLLNSTDNE